MDADIRAFLASLETQPAYTESTRQAYGSDLRIFRSYLEKHLQRSPALEDIDDEVFIRFLEEERAHGLKTTTLLRRKAALQRFEQFLRQEGRLHQQGLLFQAHVPPLLLSKEEGENEKGLCCLSDEDIRCLHEFASRSPRPVARRDLAIIGLLLETGLSVSALIALNLSDVDLGTKRFLVSFGGGKDCWLPLGASQQPLETYLSLARPELNPSPGEPALLISQLGTRMSRQGVWQVLRNCGKAANLGSMLSPRLMRHTAALRLHRAGRPLHEIQHLLGHSNPLSTQSLLHRLVAANLEKA